MDDLKNTAHLKKCLQNPQISSSLYSNYMFHYFVEVSYLFKVKFSFKNYINSIFRQCPKGEKQFIRPWHHSLPNSPQSCKIMYLYPSHLPSGLEVMFNCFYSNRLSMFINRYRYLSQILLYLRFFFLNCHQNTVVSIYSLVLCFHWTEGYIYIFSLQATLQPIALQHSYCLLW